MHNTNFRAEDFAAFVKIIALAGGRPADFKHAADRYDASGAVRALLREKSVATGDAVLADVDGVVSGFLESLRSTSLFDATVADMLQAPLNTNVTASVSMVADTVDESDPIPVSTVALDGGTLKYRKCAGFIALSNEVLRLASSAANAFLLAELRKAVGAATDANFVTGLIAETAPQSSAGTGAAEVLEDIGSLLDAVNVGANSRLHLAMPSTLAKQLAAMPTVSGTAAFPGMSPTGGSIANIPAHASDAMPSGTVMLFDASQIAGNPGTATASTTNAANLTVPDDSSPPEPVTVSAFQKNLIGIKVVRSFGFSPMREDIAASLANVAWKAEAAGA
jgi:HK97 family phage major capsid protein